MIPHERDRADFQHGRKQGIDHRQRQKRRLGIAACRFKTEGSEERESDADGNGKRAWTQAYRVVKNP